MKLIALFSMLIASTASAQVTAITGATVWTMTSDRPVEDATILLEDGRVMSVEAHGPVPAGALLISAQHKIVTPALVDAATQIGLGEVGNIDEEHRGTVSSGPLGAAFTRRLWFRPGQTKRSGKLERTASVGR